MLAQAIFTERGKSLEINLKHTFELLAALENAVIFSENPVEQRRYSLEIKRIRGQAKDFTGELRKLTRLLTSA